MIENNRTPFYKRIWFLGILNALSVFLVVYGNLIMVWLIGLPLLFAIGSGVIGAIFGGILGYTVWASANDFPARNIFLLSLIWSIFFGFIALEISSLFLYSWVLSIVPCLLFISLIIVLGLTLLLLTGRWGDLFIAGFIGIFGTIFIGLIFQILRLDINFLTFPPISGGIFGVVLAGLIKHDTNNHAEADDSSADDYYYEYEHGYMPEGEFVIGDDGELVAVSAINNPSQIAEMFIEHTTSHWYQNRWFLAIFNPVRRFWLVTEDDILSERTTSRWYHSRWFLGILNGLNISALAYWAIYSTDYSDQIVTFPLGSGLIGLIFGGVLGYTVWASTDDFHKKYIRSLALAWGMSFGILALAIAFYPHGESKGSSSAISILAFSSTVPIILLSFTIWVLKTGRRMGDLALSSFAGIVTAILIGLLLQFAGLKPHLLILSLIGGGVYGWMFAQMLRRNVDNDEVDITSTLFEDYDEDVRRVNL